MMKTVTTFVSGLLLSAVLLLPASARAAELQPFFTLKLSGVNTLVSAAEKIGTMAGFADRAEFREVITTAKGMKGFNPNEIVGVAAVVVGDEIQPILLLPITDLWGAEIPGYSDVFDTIRPFLSKKGEGKFAISSPFGTYIAVQKKDYLVITLDTIADQVPADPKKLFADLDKYTLGFKLDLEKVDFDLIEANIFGPLMMFMYMQNPEAAEQFENIIEVYRQLNKEFSIVTGGLAFDPKTANSELSGTAVPRKGSDYAKMLAGYKKQPTVFGGFRGTPENVILSFGDSATQQSPLPNQDALMEPARKQWETLLSGFMEQIEAEDEDGEISKMAKIAIDSLQKIIETETKRGASDSALSLNTEGTLLFAFDTASLAEIQKLAAMAVDFAAQRMGSVAADFDIDFKAAVKRDYVTIEGFKVSSFLFPMDKVVSLAPDPNAAEMLKGVSPGVFWAVKDVSGKQAIAVAAGLDSAKTESAFKAALEKTKTPVPVQKPIGIVSVQGLGNFLQQTVYPIAAKADAPNLAEAKKVFDILAAAGNEATVTLNTEIKPDQVEVGYHISGKAIQAIISAVKVAVEGL